MPLNKSLVYCDSDRLYSCGEGGLNLGISGMTIWRFFDVFCWSDIVMGRTYVWYASYCSHAMTAIFSSLAPLLAHLGQNKALVY